jgi:thiamine-phosphate pyrophosphorylase
LYLPTESAPEPEPASLLLCYITDRGQFQGVAGDKERRLLDKVTECSAAGVDLIQMREKDLSARQLEELAHKVVAAVPIGSRTKLLINSRTDVVLACGADGVHLPATDLLASEVRSILVRAGKKAPVIGVSTHTIEEVVQAEAHGADFAVFGPIFEKNKKQLSPRGLEQLRQACHRQYIDGAPMPVLALGGITLENAEQCFAAGATGIAAIRLFQEHAVQQVVTRLGALFGQ